ncbi:S41 family peptidase [Patulibacter minatonensis]|uniref:S41 family peptidase n=1 Tax=Patulibacter minatonensis TaxID=298163 RepID=UPI000479AAE4|nr:S41 family peptidase [Patulibacter minatonensis]
MSSVSVYTRILVAACSVVAAFVVFAGIFTIGAAFGSNHPDKLPGVVKDVAGIDQKGPSAVNEALAVIRRQYYKDPGNRELVDDAIDGMVKGLDDRFSQYLDPKAYTQFLQTQDNSFDGIGVVVSQNPRGLLIVKVYDGAPAKAAGLKVGDIITDAGGHPLKGLTSERASSFVRGKAGTSVKLEVARKEGKKEKSLTITSERKPVKVPIVDSAMKTEGRTKIAVVRLAQFTNGSAEQVAEAFAKLQKKGATRFVLDLRANPGGLVNEAQGLASQFLTKGNVVTLKGRTTGDRPFPVIEGGAFPKIPMVVLVDRNSASAAEIVTGALQDDGRATVVGTRTFGKGVFQQVEPLDSGGALDITAGQFFTPKGRNLGDKKTQSGNGTAPGKGLSPDIQAKDDPKTTNKDEGLDRALAEAAKLKG